MFNFEKLDVWNEAIAFADLIYSISRHFPDDERFGLTTQMRRAAVSISSNLAEVAQEFHAPISLDLLRSRPGRSLKLCRKRPSASDRGSSAKVIMLPSTQPRKNRAKC
jgi:hypothetical protein